MQRSGFVKTGHRKRFVIWPVVVMAILGVALIGCGGGSSSTDSQPTPTTTQTLSGTAATGAPIIGTVNVRGSNGGTSYSAIRSDGSFSVDVANLEAPYVVWASGSANGREVKLYSTCYALGNINVTPATNMALAMALGDDPESHFALPDALPPSESDLDAAAMTVADLMESIFDYLGITGFDIMSGTFAADGTGFDQLLDVVDMEVSGRSSQVVDKASGTVLFAHDLNDPMPTISADDKTTVNDAVVASLDVLDQIKLFLDTVEQLYSGTQRPTLSELQAALLGKMSADFLDSGFNAAEELEAWTDPNSDFGPQPGFTYSNVSIVRHMKSITLGDNNPITEDEKGANFDGLWATFTSHANGLTDSVTLAFVQEDEGDSWKWAGNRNPFAGGGHARVRAVSDGGQIYSGLAFWTEDEGNLAMDRGIVRLYIFNSCLPTVYDPDSMNNFQCLVMERSNSLVAEWDIISVQALWGHIYTQHHGLDLAKITDPEFVFAAVNASGDLVNLWVEKLPAMPIDESVLSADPGAYFPTVLTIGEEQASGTIPASALTGDVAVTWRHPTHADLLPDEASLTYWNDIGSYFRFEQDNPAGENPNLDPGDWTSTTFPSTYDGALVAGGVYLDYTDAAGRDFGLNYYFTVTP